MSQSATEYQIRKQMFEALYGDYQKPIELYLVKLVYNQEQASDICQETFKQLLEFLRKETVVKQYAYYRNWLYKTAKYRAIDYLRQNKPVVYLSQFESEANSWFDELRIDGIEDQIIGNHRLRKAIEQLPLKEREVLRAKYILGLKQKEIAAEYGISPPAVSQIVKSATALLHRIYWPVDVVGFVHRTYWPVNIDLRRAERWTEINKTLRQMIAAYDKDLLKLRYTEFPLYTEKQLRGMDTKKLVDIFAEHQLDLTFVLPAAKKVIVKYASPNARVEK